MLLFCCTGAEGVCEVSAFPSQEIPVLPNEIAVLDTVTECNKNVYETAQG